MCLTNWLSYLYNLFNFIDAYLVSFWDLAYIKTIRNVIT